MSTTGTNQNDTLAGTGADDTISGGNGNDTISGGAGADSLSGGNGDDVLDGGSGSDVVTGNNGNDTAIYVAFENLNAHDVYEGGNGTDTLVLKLTRAQLDAMNASTVFADFRAAAGGAFDFSHYNFGFAMNLTARGFERLTTVVVADPAPPVAAADANAITEDAPSSEIAGNVLANDALGGIADAALIVADTGVRVGLYGTLTLNADGSYTYVLDQASGAVNALNDGDALQETFSYTITDGYGHATSQLTITINGHTDPAPLFTEGDDVVDFNTVVAGTYINGTQFNALGGDDTIILPANATEAAQAGYVAGVPFRTGDGRNTVVGGALGDIVIGGAGADTIDGGGGNDTLFGGAGDDLLTGGSGEDRLDGGDGNDTFFGDGAFVDRFDGGAGVNRVDYTNSAIGMDIRLDIGVARKGFGPNTKGFDFLTNIQEAMGSRFNDVITGGGNNDTLLGGDGDDFIDGGAGNDRLDGGNGRDILFGGAGDDLFVSDAINNVLRGGDGIDTVDYSGVQFGLQIDLFFWGGAGLAPLRNLYPADYPFPPDSLSGIENVIGSQYDDLITGDDRDNRIFGGDGNDVVFGGMGSDDLDGGAGINRLDYQGSFIPVVINLADGVAIKGDPTFFVFGTDQVRNFQEVVGSNAGDRIFGDAQDNLFLGSRGNDVLDGGAGDDRIEGGADDDAMIGSAGNDHFDGGEGVDRVVYAGAGAGVTIILGPEGFARKGEAADAPVDQLRNVEEVVGSNFNDRIVGDERNNLLLGGGGNDVLEGGAGDDFLFGDDDFRVGDDGDPGDDGDDTFYGGAGDDWLLGGGGDDIFVGGPGRDSMHGFGGDDLFISDGTDNTMFGYEGIDTIDYSGVLFDLEIHFSSGWAGAKPLFSVPIDAFGGIENVIGGQGNDRIIGDNADNRITGYLGDDLLGGQGGRDVFHFDLSNGADVGNDIIGDFEIGIDRISLAGGLHHDVTELNPHQVGSHTVLDLGAGMQLTLWFTNASLLTNNDFIFA